MIPIMYPGLVIELSFGFYLYISLQNGAGGGGGPISITNKLKICVLSTTVDGVNASVFQEFIQDCSYDGHSCKAWENINQDVLKLVI